MIEITLTQALALYSGLLLAGTIGIWMYTELTVRRPQRSMGAQFLWRCIYCGCAYLDEQAAQLSHCPRCDSFNTRDEGAATDWVGETPATPETNAQSEAQRNTSRRKRPNQRSRGPRRRRR